MRSALKTTSVTALSHVGCIILCFPASMSPGPGCCHDHLATCRHLFLVLVTGIRASRPYLRPLCLQSKN
jgi:hypothetical protein